MEEILTVLPFGVTIDLVQIKGSTVKKAFEHSIDRYGYKSGQFLQVSGLSSDSSAPSPTLFDSSDKNRHLHLLSYLRFSFKGRTFGKECACLHCFAESWAMDVKDLYAIRTTCATGAFVPHA